MSGRQAGSAGMPALVLPLPLPLLLLLLLVLALRPPVADAVYFYLEGASQKCFVEDLAQKTVVHGSYSLEHGSDAAATSDLGIQIYVEYQESSPRHRILSQKGGPKGKFAFTAVDVGMHAICFSTNVTGWFTSSATRVHVDFYIGEAEVYEEEHKDEKHDVVFRIHELNNKVADIKREQTHQRENEEKFRDLSERANSRVVHWTIVQLLVIACTGLWQIRHLKGFFTEKKLV